MIRTVGDLVIAFDCEWIPDVASARLLFPDGATLSDDALLERLWEANGATASQPQPFVRLIQSRVVSIAMVKRTAPKTPGEPPKLDLAWLPRNPDDPKARQEINIVGPFVTAIGKSSPQLVGFNSRASDLRILAQRAFTLGIPAKGFLNHPAKPWEGLDYFARDNDCSVDLMDLLAGGFAGRNGAVSLHDAATLCGIPGKFNAHGDDVLALWRAGRYRDIVQYNCYDALTTYLVWLRLAWVSGKFSRDEYLLEQEALRNLLMGLVEDDGMTFLEAYLNEWDRLASIKEANEASPEA